MAIIDRLEVDLLANTAGLNDGFALSLTSLGDWQKQVEAAKPPTLAGVAADPAQFLALGAGIDKALQPVTATVGRIETAFDKVGGTVITLARRIDEAMKFPVLDNALQNIENRLPAGFLKLAVGAGRQLNKINSYLSSVGDVAGKGLGKLRGLEVPDSTVRSYTRLSVSIKSVSTVAQSAVKSTAAVGRSALATVGLFSAPAAIAGFFAAGIRGASNLNETISKTETVFGDATKTVVKNADEMALKFGLAKGSILDASAAIGLVGKAAGFTQADAGALGVNMAKLAADASSFYNVPLEDALNKIRSGLVGEAEPLRAFGVLLSEEAVQLEATRLGFARGAKGLTENAKVQARASLISRGLADATGDLARTADSPANSFRRLTGGLLNLATQVGQSFLPATSALTGGLNNVVVNVSEFVARNSAGFKTFGDVARNAVESVQIGFNATVKSLGGLSEAFEGAFGVKPVGLIQTLGATIANVFDGALLVVRNLPDFADIAFLKIRESVLNLVATFVVLPQNLGLIADYIAGNWREIIVDAVGFVSTVFANLGQNLLELGKSVVSFLQDPTAGFEFNWKSLTEGFKTTAAELPELIKPELVSLQKEIDATVGNIGAREAARAKLLADRAAAEANPNAQKRGILGQESTAPPGEIKFASAAEIGSREAYSILAQAKAARTPANTQQKIAADQLTEAKKQTALLSTLAAQRGQTKVETQYAL